MSFRSYNADTADMLGDMTTRTIKTILDDFAIAADKAGYDMDDLAALLHTAALDNVRQVAGVH